MAELSPVGAWRPGDEPVLLSARELASAVQRVREPMRVVLDADTGQPGVAFGGHLEPSPAAGALPLLGVLPALYPEWLGDRSFCEAHGVRFPYVAGAMANGIATTRMVVELARAGCLGFFGAAGLDAGSSRSGPRRARAGARPGRPGLGLEPHPLAERAGARGGRCRPLPAARGAHGRGLGLHGADPGGGALRAHRADGRRRRPGPTAPTTCSPRSPGRRSRGASWRRRRPTCSRPWSPRASSPRTRPRLGASLPLAEDVTVEADSGGHTDNRPLTALSCRSSSPCATGSPQSTATPGRSASARPAAWAPRAPWRRRSRSAPPTSDRARSTRPASSRGCQRPDGPCSPRPGVADVMMAPAADMFELGVKVQVLRRGTHVRAARAPSSTSSTGPPTLEAIPAAERGAPRAGHLPHARSTRAGRTPSASGGARDPRQVERADARPQAPHGARASAGTSASRAGGRSTATVDAAPTSRSGAARRWPPSTTGPRARSSRKPGTGPWSRSRATCSRGRRWSPAPSSCAPSAFPCRPSAFAFRPRPLA